MIPTLINFTLDSSGSMAGVAQSTILGFNSFLEEQRALADGFLTLTVFHTQQAVYYAGKPLSKVPPLGSSASPYSPNGGTALFDAVGDGIKAAEQWIATTKFTGQVLNVILTDGQENSSDRWHVNIPTVQNDDLDVAGLIKWKSDVDGWKFLFLGSGGSEWLENTFRHTGIDPAFFVGYHAQDTGSTYKGMSNSVAASRATGADFNLPKP